MENEFPFGLFHAEKQDYFLRCSVAPGNFPSGRHKKSFSIYSPTGFPGKLLGKQPMRTEQSPPCKGIRNTESGKILLMESGIQLKKSGIH